MSMPIYLYINKDTNQPGTQPYEWSESIADAADKQAVQAIFDIEYQRMTVNEGAGAPSADFDAVFARYCAECNIEPRLPE